MKNYKKLEKCRVCSNENLKMVLDLGEQELTGVLSKKQRNSNYFRSDSVSLV